MCKMVGAFFMLVVVVAAHPAKDELMFAVGDDTAVVESTVREARAVVPEHIEDLLKPGTKEAFLYTYGDKKSDDGDVQGYRKKTQDKGSDGYKHFDSYHKKDGDKYGFEKHSEYGKSDKAKAEGGAKKKGGDGAETKNTYKVLEDVKEDKKGVRALEDYEGDSGYYVESGEGGSYSEAEAEAEGGDYVEGDDGESEYYEGGEGGDDGESESYVEYEEGGDYTEAEDDDY